VLSKHKVILHSHNVVFILWIIVFEMLKDLDLYSCLVMELLLVLHNLHCHVLIVLMIEAFEALSETSRAQGAGDFVSIGDVIL
jgi:hypothetical protein